MDTPILPFNPSGKPGFLVILFQLSPPSNDIYIPDSGPPLSNLQKLLFACQIVVINILGLPGSILKSAAPELLLINNTFFQFTPPSLDLNIPLSELGPKACPNAATYTVL